MLDDKLEIDYICKFICNSSVPIEYYYILIVSLRSLSQITIFAFLTSTLRRTVQISRVVWLFFCIIIIKKNMFLNRVGCVARMGGSGGPRAVPVAPQGANRHHRTAGLYGGIRVLFSYLRSVRGSLRVSFRCTLIVNVNVLPWLLQ